MDSDQLISVDSRENKEFLSFLSLLTPTAENCQSGEKKLSSFSYLFLFKFKVDMGPTMLHTSITRPGSFLSRNNLFLFSSIHFK